MYLEGRVGLLLPIYQDYAQTLSTIVESVFDIVNSFSATTILSHMSDPVVEDLPTIKKVIADEMKSWRDYETPLFFEDTIKAMNDLYGTIANYQRLNVPLCAGTSINKSWNAALTRTWQTLNKAHSDKEDKTIKQSISNLKLSSRAKAYYQN